MFSDNLVQRDEEATTAYIKTDELLEGTYEVLGADIIEANNKKYGANEKDALFIKGILQEGETIRYNFVTKDKEEKTYDSKGASFYYGMKQANPEPGDKVTFSREGDGENRRYSVNIIEPK